MVSGDWQEQLWWLFRFALAGGLGAWIGWERETHGKDAGIRTHALVAMGAAMALGLAERVIGHFDGHDDLQFDPIRVLEAVATAVSFLAAGLIVFAKPESRVHGLTTAAALWATASVGVAVGLGAYVLAFGGAALVYAVLRCTRHGG